jgi:hypothetical protein
VTAEIHLTISATEVPQYQSWFGKIMLEVDVASRAIFRNYFAFPKPRRIRLCPRCLAAPLRWYRHMVRELTYNYKLLK